MHGYTGCLPSLVVALVGKLAEISEKIQNKALLVVMCFGEGMVGRIIDFWSLFSGQDRRYLWSQLL